MFSGPGMSPMVGRIHSNVKAGCSIKLSGTPGESEGTHSISYDNNGCKTTILIDDTIMIVTLKI